MSCLFDIHGFHVPLPQHTHFEKTRMLEDCTEGAEYKLCILGTGNLSGLKGFDSYLLIKDVPTVIFIPISQET